MTLEALLLPINPTNSGFDGIYGVTYLIIFILHICSLTFREGVRMVSNSKYYTGKRHSEFNVWLYKSFIVPSHENT